MRRRSLSEPLGVDLQNRSKLPITFCYLLLPLIAVSLPEETSLQRSLCICSVSTVFTAGILRQLIHFVNK